MEEVGDPEMGWRRWEILRQVGGGGCMEVWWELKGGPRTRLGGEGASDPWEDEWRFEWSRYPGAMLPRYPLMRGGIIEA